MIFRSNDSLKIHLCISMRVFENEIISSFEARYGKPQAWGFNDMIKKSPIYVLA